MNPFQHGEVFVTDDGGETDLDLGHYERFTGRNLLRDSNVTTGSVYQAVIQKERRGDLPGRHGAGHPPHHQRDQEPDSPDRGAHRGRRGRSPRSAAPSATSRSSPSSRRSASCATTSATTIAVFVHVTLVPYIGAVGGDEDQADPAQRRRAAQPGHHARRHRGPLRPAHRRGGAPQDQPLLRRPVGGGHQRPRRHQHLRGAADRSTPAASTRWCAAKLATSPPPSPTSPTWRDMVDRMARPRETVTIALVGKYIDLPDAYLSVVEALRHGALGGRRRPRSPLDRPATRWKGMLAETRLTGIDGIVVPGGFGVRGIEGKIAAVPLRPGEPDPLPRPVPRPAVRRDRVRPVAAGPARRQLERVRPAHLAPGHRPDGEPQQARRGDGRHHAARPLRRPAGRGHRIPAASTARS